MYRRGNAHVADTQSRVVWIKGSRCEGGTCVEIAALNERILVRDSKVPDGPVLDFPQASWRAFTDALRTDSL
jgi:hypothetical protein